MKKYWQVVLSTLWEIGTYRFNFVMWRFRVVLQFLTIYFLWLAVSTAQQQIFGYSQQLILTYVLCTAFVSSLVLSTRTQEIGANINSGDLSLFLLRPINYFLYWFARDIGDKAVNLGFSIVELVILYLILKPSLFIQTDGVLIIITVVTIAIAVFLNFYVGCLLGLIGFWSPEVWAPRFLYYVLVPFLGGAVFPLDIFPHIVQQILLASPFSYMIYFPVKIYLGGLSNAEIIQGLIVASLWIIVFHIGLHIAWFRGLKIYSAQGR